MSFLDLREQELGFRPQYENKTSTLFRDVPGYDAKSVECYKKIKRYLALSIANDDADRTSTWLANLSGYMNSCGLKFDRSDHIELIKLCYDLICVPGLSKTLLKQAAVCLSALLRKPETLSPEDLNLDWKPLYDVLKYYHLPDESNDRMKNNVYWTILQQAVTKVKTYFKETATQEIFQSETENFCPFSPAKQKQSFFILSALLPMEFVSGKEATAYRHWFEPLMTFWQSMSAQRDVETEIMDICSNFSFNNPGVIDWSPYMPFIYTRIIASTGGTSNSAKHNKDGKLHIAACARWIVSTLGARQNGQIYLDKFMAVYRTYKKSERLPTPLEILMKNIILSFWNRINRESTSEIYWKSPVPDDVKINDDDIDALINSIFTTFAQCINLMHLLKESDVISILTALRPKVVVPKCLASFDEAFSDICFPIKYLSILESMGSIVHACVFTVNNGSFPEGAELLVPLLTKVLSYEPMTNLVTVLNTFHVVSSFFSLVPVVDTSASNITTEFSETEAIVNANSSAYEEIALKMLDIIFTHIDSLQHIQTRLDSEAKSPDPAEQIQSSMITEDFSGLLLNVSPQILKSMIEKYKRFVFGEVKETIVAAKIIGKIGKAFSKIDPETTLKFMVSELVSEINGCLDSDGNLVEDRSESDLMYYLTILADVLDCESPIIKKWIPLIATIFPSSLLKCSIWDCVKLSASCIKSCFIALSSVAVKHESVVQRYENPELCPLEDWGTKRKYKDLKFTFGLPGAEEKACIEDLLEKFIWPQVEYLEEFSAQDEKSREPVRKAILILSTTSPVTEVSPRWEEDPLFGLPNENESEILTNLLFNLDVTFPGNRNIRQTIVNVLIRTTDKIFEIDEHFVKALRLLTGALGRILGLKIETCLPDREYMTWSRNPLPTERRNEPFVFHMYKIRRFVNKFSHLGQEMLTETHKGLIHCLMKLAVSDYHSVRNLAIHCLTFIENDPTYFGVSNIIYPQITANLMLNPHMDSPVYKGTIDMMLLCCRDVSHPKLLKAGVWPLVFKPNGLSETDVGAFFTRFTLKIEQSSRRVHKLSSSLSNNEAPALDLKDIYNATVDSLLSLDFQSTDGLVLPWNFQVMHLNLLRILDYPDQTLPLRAFIFVLEKLFSDLSPVHRAAFRTVFSILRALKKKYVRHVYVETSEVVQLKDTWEFGEDELTDRIQYMGVSRLVHNGKILFIHKNHVGYSSWPSQLKVNVNWDLEEDYPGAILSVFTAESVKKLLSIACTRSSPNFCQNNSRFYEFIFIICPRVVEIFLDELDQLFNSTADEILLSACVEVLCGILKSMKYWPIELRAACWPSLLDIFDRGIKWKLRNSANHWGHCFSIGLTSTDPEMVVKLIDLLMDWKFDDSSFAADLSKRIHLLTTAILNFSWRMASFNSTLLNKISPYIDHESQIIRNEIAKLLVIIFCEDLEFKGKRSTRSPRLKDFINILVLPSIKCLITTPEDEDPEKLKKSKRALTTVCRWLTLTLKNRTPVCPEMYKLVPILCYTSGQDELEWEELKLLSKEVLQTLAKQSMCSSNFQIVFPGLMLCYQYFKDFQLKGKTRVEYFNFLQVFVFYSRPHIQFSNEYVNDLKQNTLLALSDDNIEVRLAAKKMLADMIHFKILTDVDSLIETFTVDCRKRVVESDPKTLITRQSAILGLLACLTANPDNVPEYLSRVFTILSRYSNDKHPVRQWIGKEVSDFMLLHENTRQKVEEVISREILDEFGGAHLSYFS